MSNTQTSSPKSAPYKPGDIIELGGIKFIVLDDLGPCEPGSTEHDLFIRALESQGHSPFGSPYHSTNNYAKSSLKLFVEDWFAEFTKNLSENGLHPEKCKLIKSRVIDLTTVSGYKGFGSLGVFAAPLTMDEARKYADVIPNPDEPSWLVNGWAGPGKFGSPHALFVRTDGFWEHSNCAYARAIHPALIVSTALLEHKVTPELSTNESTHSTGIIRRLDYPGTIMIPDSVLYQFNLLEGDPLEIIPMEDGIFLRKYTVECPIADELKKSVAALNSVYPHVRFFALDEYGKILSSCEDIPSSIQSSILYAAKIADRGTVCVNTAVESDVTNVIITVPVSTNKKTVGMLMAVASAEALDDNGKPVFRGKDAIINTMRVLAACNSN